MTRTDGDSYARYLLHVEEIKQSLRIIDQVLHQMPDFIGCGGISFLQHLFPIFHKFINMHNDIACRK